MGLRVRYRISHRLASGKVYCWWVDVQLREGILRGCWVTVGTVSRRLTAMGGTAEYFAIAEGRDGDTARCVRRQRNLAVNFMLKVLSTIGAQRADVG